MKKIKKKKTFRVIDIVTRFHDHLQHYVKHCRIWMKLGNSH